MRRHSLKTLWVVVVLLLLVGIWSLDAPVNTVRQVDGGAPAPDCEEWSTEEFFHTATLEQVTACLAAGADVNARSISGLTPLHLAAGFNEYPAVIGLLLEAGANLEAQDDDGATPLHRAVLWIHPNPAVTEALLAAGADVNARNIPGYTPLYLAAGFSRNAAVIGLLLEAGANLEARDADGATPLHRAVLWYNQNPAVIGTLLDAGANAAARNAAGQTPWDLAQENEALKGSDAYRRLNDARRAPGGGSAGGPAGTVDTGAGGEQ